MITLVILSLIVSSMNVIYAQNSENSNTLSSYEGKFQKLDDIMTAQIAATLTGLSLTGGSFLAHLARDVQDSTVKRINLARRSFIKAFFMFLMCTVSVFLFDFIAILHSNYFIIESFLDIIVTYTLFGIGTFYLVRAARALYVTYGSKFS